MSCEYLAVVWFLALFSALFSIARRLVGNCSVCLV